MSAWCSGPQFCARCIKTSGLPSSNMDARASSIRAAVQHFGNEGLAMGSTRSRFVALGCVFLMLLGLVSCGDVGSSNNSGSGGREQGGTLTILAASSLIDAFGELGKTFEEQNEGVTVKQSFE